MGWDDVPQDLYVPGCWLPGLRARHELPCPCPVHALSIPQLALSNTAQSKLHRDKGNLSKSHEGQAIQAQEKEKEKADPVPSWGWDSWLEYIVQS